MTKEKMIIGALVLTTVGLATTAPAQTLSAQDLARRTFTQLKRISRRQTGSSRLLAIGVIFVERWFQESVGSL